MKNKKWNIGVCSWSLGTDPDDVASAMKTIGIDHINLAVGPALGDGGSEYMAAVKRQKWIISCTMINFKQEDYSTLDTIRATGGIVPDDCWQENLKRFTGAAEVTKKLGVKYILMHAGFIDHNDNEKYRTMCHRIKCLADIAAGSGITLLMETGQETAEELSSFIKHLRHPSIAINFDPANMILYDKGDPIKAVKLLSSWVKHIHIKDAVKTKMPGRWGTEVVWGDGQVSSDRFLAALKDVGYEGTLAVEREAGFSRLEDIAIAVERLRQYTG